MIRSCITIKVDPCRRWETLSALRSSIGPTRADPGCLSCDLYCDAEDDCRLSLVQEWRTQDHLRRHLRSKSYLGLLQIMELSTVEPQVQFDAVATRRGIELIHEERESSV